MNILIFGSNGFIGKKVTKILQNQGHILILPTSREIDFTQPNLLDLPKITALLQNVDVIINMVGVMSHDNHLMENVHHHTPFKIAQIAKQVGVEKWINLSALGADPSHEVAFVGSKGRGDKAILHLNDESFRVKIARPSLVFGLGENGEKGGASTELFLKLAKLPILPLPNGGNFAIQPVAVEDVAQGLANLAVHDFSDLPAVIDFSGSEVTTLANYLTALRVTILQKNPPKIVNIPIGLAKLSAQILQPFSNMVSVDSLTLLENGNVADNADFARLLNHKF